MGSQLSSTINLSRPQWYLLQSKPRQAERAELNLGNQGYQVFHPRLPVERIRRGRRNCCLESLFTNYLFVLLQPGVDDWAPLRSTRGVSRVVRFGEYPMPVPDALIEAIKRRIESTPQTSLLKEGDRVEILDGPFRHLEAIFHSFDGERRAILLIEILRQETRLSLPLNSVTVLIR